VVQFEKKEQSKMLNSAEQEQLAAQIVALMDASFKRPTIEEKNNILHLAANQISSTDVLFPSSGVQGFPERHEARDGHSSQG
jgi:hypothetical protein